VDINRDRISKFKEMKEKTKRAAILASHKVTLEKRLKDVIEKVDKTEELVNESKALKEQNDLSFDAAYERCNALDP
jgi:hypothetical protein